MKANLKTLQLEVQNLVINGMSTDFFSPKGTAWVADTPQALSKQERISIYSRGWFLRLEESIRDDYSLLASTIDAEVWSKIVQDYLVSCPSTSFTLARAGDDLPKFLREQNVVEHWQVDLAKLEMAVYKSRNAVDTEIWEIERLQSFTQEEAAQIKFTLNSGVFLLQSKWNISDSYKNQIFPPAQVETKVIVWRKGFTVEVSELSNDEWKFLLMAKDGATLNNYVESFEGESWVLSLSKFVSSGVMLPLV